jgi:hypothetical protein
MNVIGRLDYAEGQNFFMVANHQPAIEFMRFGGSIATIGKHLIFALAKTLSPPFCTNIGSALSFGARRHPAASAPPF